MSRKCLLGRGGSDDNDGVNDVYWGVVVVMTMMVLMMSIGAWW